MRTLRAGENVTALPTSLPPCTACGGNGSEVWPCAGCGHLLHVECAVGVEYRDAEWPPQTVDGRPVIGTWNCAECAAVVGYDVPTGDDHA